MSQFIPQVICEGLYAAFVRESVLLARFQLGRSIQHAISELENPLDTGRQQDPELRILITVSLLGHGD